MSRSHQLGTQRRRLRRQSGKLPRRFDVRHMGEESILRRQLPRSLRPDLRQEVPGVDVIKLFLSLSGVGGGGEKS